MSERARKTKVTRIRNGLYREIANGGWNLNGKEFWKYTSLGVYSNVRFQCVFSCNLKKVRVRINGVEEYNIGDREQTFTGENAMSESIDWVTEVLYEMCTTVEERKIAASEAWYEYQRKLQGV